MSLRVLLFGGNAVISRLMASKMLERSWDVISVVRSPRQKDELLRLGAGHKGKMEVMVCDLAKLHSTQDARSTIDSAKANTIVFAAGSMSNPFGVDRDAAKHIMNASATNDTITKFLFISFPASRRKRAPWWSDGDYRDWVAEKSSYPDIWQAKLEADEHLVATVNARKLRGGLPLQAISLRPTWLTNKMGTGRVQLGRAGSQGQISREDVARVAVSLLSRDDTSGWLDLFQGDTEIEHAIEKVVRERIDCIEGEELDRIYQLAGPRSQS